MERVGRVERVERPTRRYSGYNFHGKIHKMQLKTLGRRGGRR